MRTRDGLKILRLAQRCPTASTSSHIPKRRKRRIAAGVKPSPQTFSRGNHCRSQSKTRCPREASSMAATLPPGPPPTTITSQWPSGRSSTANCPTENLPCKKASASFAMPLPLPGPLADAFGMLQAYGKNGRIAAKREKKSLASRLRSQTTVAEFIRCPEPSRRGIPATIATAKPDATRPAPGQTLVPITGDKTSPVFQSPSFHSDREGIGDRERPVKRHEPQHRPTAGSPNFG